MTLGNHHLGVITLMWRHCNGIWLNFDTENALWIHWIFIVILKYFFIYCFLMYCFLSHKFSYTDKLMIDISSYIEYMHLFLNFKYHSSKYTRPESNHHHAYKLSYAGPWLATSRYNTDHKEIYDSLNCLRYMKFADKNGRHHVTISRGLSNVIDIFAPINSYMKIADIYQSC